MLTLAAGLGATLAMVFLGLRAQMLKPVMASWPDAPRCVRWASFGLSALMGSYGAALIDGHRASSWEAVILLAIAAYAGLLWVNLYRQARAGMVPADERRS